MGVPARDPGGGAAPAIQAGTAGDRRAAFRHKAGRGGPGGAHSPNPAGGGGSRPEGHGKGPFRQEPPGDTAGGKLPVCGGGPGDAIPGSPGRGRPFDPGPYAGAGVGCHPAPAGGPGGGEAALRRQRVFTRHRPLWDPAGRPLAGRHDPGLSAPRHPSGGFLKDPPVRAQPALWGGGAFAGRPGYGGGAAGKGPVGPV